jgi:hypothetical protein
MADKRSSGGGDVTEGGIKAGRDIRAGGDIIGRDKAGRDIAGRDIRHESSQPDLQSVFAEWSSQLHTKIDAQPELSEDEKDDLKTQVDKIQSEAAKGKETDPGRLEKLINTLAVMAPDIFEVAVATLANPLAGIGLVLKKIGDKASLTQA